MSPKTIRVLFLTAGLAASSLSAQQFYKAETADATPEKFSRSLVGTAAGLFALGCFGGACRPRRPQL